MRTINRIDILLNDLKIYWKQPSHSDLRLGQIIYNINKELTGSEDVFNIEDDKIIEWLSKNLTVNMSGGRPVPVKNRYLENWEKLTPKQKEELQEILENSGEWHTNQ